MEIGILTLPFNANYGGILQAYALQTALEHVGHHARHINAAPHYSLRPLLRPVAYAKRLFEQRILGRNKRVLLEAHNNAIVAHTNLFIQRHIRLAPCATPTAVRPSDFEAIVVGSDQVWRRDFWPDMATPFLDFAAQWDIRRIAYAASFGLDRWLCDEQTTRRCADLLSRFDHVSVREYSGIQLCKDHLHREAALMPDPTMLLDASDYRRLITADSRRCADSGSQLFAYILGHHPATSALIEAVAQEKRLAVNAIYADDYWRRPTAQCVRPPLEDWLRGIAEAELIVTNSFHGCVMAAIFQKPFIVVQHAAGGATRITTLLQNLGMSSAIVDDSRQMPDDLDAYIHDSSATDVQTRLAQLRQLGMTFLNQIH